jgi:hypothetical protein
VATRKPLAAPQEEQAALEVRAYTIETARGQLAQQVAAFNEALERRLDTAGAAARTLYDQLLGPARAQLADRRDLVIVPDDSLWTLPFEALQARADHALDEDATITLLPSVAAWILKPAQMDAPATEETATQVLVAAGTVSDVTPLQSTLTLVGSLRRGPDAVMQPLPPSPPLAAWELFEHPLRADMLVLLDRALADERLRLEQGRLGAMGLAWAAQIAGVPRVLIARRPLPREERDRFPSHEPAAFMLIGSPR